METAKDCHAFFLLLCSLSALFGASLYVVVYHIVLHYYIHGKSREAVDINANIDRILLSVNFAFASLVECKIDFDATAVKEHCREVWIRMPGKN